VVCTHWGATDVLGFYGSVLGGFATLIAIYITIIRENKIRREENAKQEKERNRQMAIQRLNFVSSNLCIMLSKIDYSHFILDTFADNIANWREEPHEIYRFFNETRSVIFINVDFTIEENEIIDNEFKHSPMVTQKYSTWLRFNTALFYVFWCWLSAVVFQALLL